jgi:flagella basal body P-ring formation protein FlgA
MRSLNAAFILSVLSVSPVVAEAANWGSADLRREMVDWLRSNGRNAPDPMEIGPLDPRLSVSACDQLEITPRGLSSTTFILRCKAPADWSYVLRIDQSPQSPAIRADAGKVADPAATWVVITPRVNLSTGLILTADMLEERRVTAAPPPQAFKAISDAVGLRVSSPVGPGLTLTTRNVARPPLVARGENVTLVANGSGFEISVPGKAEQDGFEGDLISVKNTRTGALLKGRLERGKIVSVAQL